MCPRTRTAATAAAATPRFSGRRIRPRPGRGVARRLARDRALARRVDPALARARRAAAEQRPLRRPGRPDAVRPAGPTSPHRASPSPSPPACGHRRTCPRRRPPTRRAARRPRSSPGRPRRPGLLRRSRRRRRAGADPRRHPTPGCGPPRSPGGASASGQLLFAGLALAVAALASITLLMLDGDDGPDPVTLGEVGAAEPGATVRTGARVAAPRGRRGRSCAGDVVQAPSTGAVTVDLEGGGVVRFDTGASVTFIDDAIDAETGERDGDSEPALQILAGRAWVNPADGTTVEVRLPGGRATTVANPVAIECPGDCTLHAPAAGVDIDSDGGADAAPIPTEIVDLARRRHA